MSHIDGITPATRSGASAAAGCCDDAVTPELLAQIAVGLGQSGVERLVPPGEQRRWALALESEAYEAWVIAWPGGTGLDFHGHDGSLAAVYVVSGRLRERYVSEHASLAVRWLSSGDAVELPADHLHEMINVDGDEAISVHVYSPRLQDQTFRETAAI